MEFRHIYRQLLDLLLRNGVTETNSRTGEEILILPGGFYFQVDLSKEELPVIDCRLTHPKTAAAEVAWFLQGTQDTSWLNKHTGIWKAFEEPLTITKPGRNFIGQSKEDIMGVRAAYGYRWIKHYGLDQLFTGLSTLQADPSSRRVWITAWDPIEDLQRNGQKNVPCPVGFNLYVVNGRLFSSYVLRSSDVFMGLPYDVMNHALLLSVLAKTIGLKLGGMSFTLAHAHLYKRHEFMAKKCLEEKSPAGFEPMENPGFFTAGEIQSHPDNFVNYVADAATQKFDWPTYDPKPSIVI